MSLARRYRLKFAAQRGDRLVLCLACAVAVHVGMMAVSLKIWQTEAAPVEPVALQPIEFVYLDSESVEPPLKAERISNSDSQANGTHLDLLAAAGKPVEAKLSEIVPSKPLTPPAAGTYIPTQSQGDASKVIEPEPAAKPELTEPAITVPQNDSPAQEGGLLPAPLSPSAKPDPISTSTPRQADIPLPRIQPAVPIDIPTTPSTDAVTDAVITPSGVGLDGLPNPNRTAVNNPALNNPTIDAQADAIWGQYSATLTQSIEEQWHRITPDVTRETLIRFEVDRQGRLISLETTQSSGSAIADQSAVEAIQAAAPFAPLPAETTDPSVVINFRFTHAVRSPR